MIGERAPWWAPPRLNERVTEPHPRSSWSAGSPTSATTRGTGRARRSTRCWASSPTTCQNEPATQARAEALKDRLLDHPAVATTFISLWDALRRALTASLEDPEGAVRERMLTEVCRFAERLVDDAELRTRLDTMAADAAVFIVDRYGNELTSVITQTIERWDGREAARRIELHVGPRPAVHPDQRHHRRRPGRRADPRGERASSTDLASVCSPASTRRKLAG